MFGKNPLSPIIEGNGNQLQVVAIFATIQGEGPRSGQPAIFIRLGGCNLACKFCDTDFDNFKNMSLEEILAEVEAKRTAEKLIVITGGEPLRQPIENLCAKLLGQGYIVQIETNGMLFRDLPQEVEIVCCPKTGTKLDERTERRITAYKYLVSTSREKYKTLPQITHNRPVYVQPIDEYDDAKSADNVKLAVNIAKQGGYNLSLQIHKIIGVE